LQEETNANKGYNFVNIPINMLKINQYRIKYVESSILQSLPWQSDPIKSHTSPFMYNQPHANTIYDNFMHNEEYGASVPVLHNATKTNQNKIFSYLSAVISLEISYK